MTVSSLLACKMLGALHICEVLLGRMLPLLSSIKSANGNRLVSDHPRCRPTLFILLATNLIIIMAIIYISDKTGIPFWHSFMAQALPNNFSMQLYAFSVLQTLCSVAIFFLKCSIKKL